MADNVAITPGAGAAVSTEEVTTLNGESVDAQHVQRVVLALRTGDGAATDVGTETARLPTDVGAAMTEIPSGEVSDPALRVKIDQKLFIQGLDGTLWVGSNGEIKIVTDSPLEVRPVGGDAFLIQGTVAHDGAAANNPVLNGGYAVNVEPAAVANGDVARLVTDLVGKLITLPYANPENFVAGKTAAITDTTRTAVIAAPGAGVRNYVTHLLITNSHATVGTYVKVEDGTTEIYGGYAAPAGGGFSVTLPVPLRLSANTALNVTCATTGANVYASASGYKGV